MRLDRQPHEVGLPAPVSGEVAVPSAGRRCGRVDPSQHREVVVRRLLSLGISVRGLVVLLPEWGTLIRSTALAMSPDELPPHEREDEASG